MILFVAVPFLAAGCACFLVCATISPLRRFALSTSLWCVACIPCLITILTAVILWGLGVDALRRFLKPDFGTSVSVYQTSLLGWLLAITTLLVTIAGASVITFLHGFIVRRLTLALFRIYLAAVSFGVGIVTCSFVLLAFAAHLLSLSSFLPAAVGSLTTASALGYVCFRNASGFRGAYPERFPIVTPEEFRPV